MISEPANEYVEKAGCTQGISAFRLAVRRAEMVLTPFQPGLLREPRPIMVNLHQILHHTVQLPLDMYLVLLAQTEPPQSECATDVRKYRLDSSHAATVLMPTLNRIYLLPYLIDMARWRPRLDVLCVLGREPTNTAPPPPIPSQ